MTEYFNAPHDSSFNDARAFHNSLHGRSSYNPYPNGVPRAAHESLSPQYSSSYRPPRGPITYGNAVPEVRRVTAEFPLDNSFRSPARSPGMPMGSPMPGAAHFREHDQVSPTRFTASGPTHVDYGPQDTMPVHPEPSWVPIPQEDSRHLSFFPPKASTPAPDVPRYGETPRYHPQEISNFADDSRYPEQGSEFVENSAHYGGERPDETVQTILSEEFDRADGPFDDEEMEEMEVQPVDVDHSYGESAHLPGGMPASTPYNSEPPYSVATHDIPQVVDLHDIPKPEKGKKKFVGGWIWGLFPKKSSSKSATSQPHPTQPIAMPTPVRMPSQRNQPQLRPYARSPDRVPKSMNRLPHQSPQAAPNYPTGGVPYQSPRNAASSPDRLPNQSPNGARLLSPRPSERSHGSRSSRPLRSRRSATFSGSSSDAPFSQHESAGPAGDVRPADDEQLPNPYEINPRPAALASPEAVHLQHAEDYDEMSDPYVTTRADTTFSSRVNRIGSFFSGLFHLPWISAHVSVEYHPSDSRRARYDKPKKSWYSKGGHEKLDLLAAPSPTQMRSPTVQVRRVVTERDRERARERRERERGERQRHRARSAQRDAQREREHQQRSRSAPARARSPASNSSSGNGRAATAVRHARPAVGATAHDGAAVFASPGASGVAGQTISTSYVYPALWVVPPGAQIGSPPIQGQEQQPKPDGASPPAGQVQPNMLPGSRGPSPLIVSPNVPYVVIGAGPWPMSSGTASPPPRRQSPKQRSTQRRTGRKGSSESPPPPMPVPSTSARRLSVKG